MLNYRPWGVTAAALVLLCCATRALAVFPQIESFSNDTDSFAPSNTDPLNDPNLDGDPPATYEDIRTGGVGVIEEVPTGFEGITASEGNHFGIVQFESGNGPMGHPSAQTAPLASAWSYQMDVYTDSSVAPTLGVAGGGFGDGRDTTADWWWTNAVRHNVTGDYLTETGFDFEILDNGISPRRWMISSTIANYQPYPGAPVEDYGAPYFLAPVDTWYTLEVKYKDNGGSLAAELNIWNQAHTQLLFTQTQTTLFLNPATSDLGGPDYTWFVYPDLNVSHVFVDNVGVGPPIALPPTFILGDMDGDGDRDNFDIDDFELALTNSAAYLALHPTLTDYQQRGDIEGDNDFDNFDIQPFEALLTGGPGPGAPVPEPAGIVLGAMGLGGLALVARRRTRRSA